MLGRKRRSGVLGKVTYMRFRFWACLGSSLQICVSALADPVVTSKISEVIVYADRARVSREVTVNVPGGDSQFEVTDLPGDLDENSVGITVRSGNTVVIRGLDVRREFLSENADARGLDLRKQLEQLQDQKRDFNHKKECSTIDENSFVG
jgi:uncharacterized protein DUF4140